MNFSKTLATLLFCIVLSSCSKNDPNTLTKKRIGQLRSSVLEVVVPKYEDPDFTYERPLPFDKLPFKEREDDYHSVGTAFFISETQLVSAAHVFNVPHFSLYKDYYVRDKDSNVYAIQNVHKYSNHKDLIVFDLKNYPDNKISLELKNNVDVGDIVFSVGNAQGEGISFRQGQIASFTPEVIDGQWNDIRFSSAASPGNSGGPLITADGQAVGVIIKKNESENLNYAVPVNLLPDLSSKNAEFLIKDAQVALFHEENSLTKDWKSKIELPMEINELSSKAQKSFDQFMAKLFEEIDEQYKGKGFPNSDHFKTYLRNPKYISGFGTITTDPNFKNWDVSNYNGQEIQVTENQKAYYAHSDLGTLFVSIDKPEHVSLISFLRDPKLLADTMLKSVPLTRIMGKEKIKVTSMGKPEKSLNWSDDLGRKWFSHKWNLAWIDSFFYLHCNARPKGVFCHADIRENSNLMAGYYQTIFKNHNEVVIGYNGEIKDWIEFVQLPKEYLSDYFNKIDMAFNDHRFKLKTKEFKIDFNSSDVSQESSLHFHMGHAPETVLNEELLLFEIFPQKGSQNDHYRVQKMFEAKDDNSDEYKKTWEDVVAQTGIYKGELYLDGQTQNLRFSTARPQRATASGTFLSTRLVQGCGFNNTTPKPEVKAKCLNFKASVEAL